jgi:hypothetical protein
LLFILVFFIWAYRGLEKNILTLGLLSSIFLPYY